jgi:PhzF family phenazine biosynthesis protein
MSARRFQLVNVFTVDEDRFSGNPLCVFEDGSGLDDRTMQAIARQLNLSETTFVLASERATAQVRIFTPTFEMPFAGHPTLGTAHVVNQLKRAGSKVVLEMRAGLVEVHGVADAWTLKAAGAPETRPPEASNEELARMLNLPVRAIAGPAKWVDTGAEQLVIPLASADDVRAARPDPALLLRHGFSKKRGAAMAYVFAHESAEYILARFFFDAHGAAIEDPATGSACANLGGWWITEGRPLPVERVVRQGDAVGRPSLLKLSVDAMGSIFVGGRVLEIGRGELDV